MQIDADKNFHLASTASIRLSLSLAVRSMPTVLKFPACMAEDKNISGRQLGECNPGDTGRGEGVGTGAVSEMFCLCRLTLVLIFVVS